MHPVFVTEAAEGLAQAYGALALDPETRAAIARQVGQVATSPAYAWPAVRLNQFHWPVAIFAAHAAVNGDSATLATGLGRHLDAFLAAAARNLGPGLHFHYLPTARARPRTSIRPSTRTSCSGSRATTAPPAAPGMRPPSRRGLLRAWARRVLAGAWTHAGYLNWDTGLGFHRWHQRKKVPLAQQALVGIAAEPELWPGESWGRGRMDAGPRPGALPDLADREGGSPGRSPTA